MFVFHTFLIILIAGEKIVSSSLNWVVAKKKRENRSSSTLNILWRGHHPVVLMVSKETVHLEYQIESAINTEQTLLFFISYRINYYCSLRLSYSYSYSEASEFPFIKYLMDIDL
jgi:hypothetical protein